MKSIEHVPFLDLVAPHRQLEPDLTAVFRSALLTAGFIGGPVVEEFERRFAEFVRVKHCIGVGSGTDAVRFALLAAGVGKGDIVVTVPSTFIATSEAISQTGAVPDFVDVDERSSNLDPEALDEYLATQCQTDPHTGQVRHRLTGYRIAAVVPVHLYGQPADMDPILEIARHYNLLVIEDACQAHGAEYFSRREDRWRSAGSMGVAGAFSFYPGKNLGACGEAGAVTTNNDDVARSIRMLRDHGQAQKYYHDIEGYNGRLDAIQAGILLVKLNLLAGWNQCRRDNADYYNHLFATLAPKVVTPDEPCWAQSVYHLYVIRTPDRDALASHLKEAGIGIGIHYPSPLHLQKAYRSLNYGRGSFPVAEKLARQILSLPMYPQLRPEQQRRVVESVSEFLAHHGASHLESVA